MSVSMKFLLVECALNNYVSGVVLCLGESASGKTQFCMQCCLAVQWPEGDGGLNGKAM